MSASAPQWLGRAFISPVWDYLLIGSAWSIVATVVMLLLPGASARLDTTTLVILVLLLNSAHFAASTVRLYSDPANFRQHPFLTLILPLLLLLMLAVFIFYPAGLGRHWQALYLTWSPYHYAAQTFGLTMMYCHRSSVKIDPLVRRMLYWICLLPFLRAFLGASNSGLGWFISREQLSRVPYALEMLGSITDLLTWLTFILPMLLLIYFYQSKRSGFPLICLCMMIANGMWWILLDFIDAFVIATIAHSVQYLAIVLIYHVRDQTGKADNQRGPLYHIAGFYLKCLLLGYGLFYIWPHAFVFAGAGLAESMLLVIATINIHHFIVDRYIWRMRKPKVRAVVAEPDHA